MLMVTNCRLKSSIAPESLPLSSLEVLLLTCLWLFKPCWMLHWRRVNNNYLLDWMSWTSHDGKIFWRYLSIYSSLCLLSQKHCSSLSSKSNPFASNWIQSRILRYHIRKMPNFQESKFYHIKAVTSDFKTWRDQSSRRLIDVSIRFICKIRLSLISFERDKRVVVQNNQRFLFLFLL
jgi:hypothetical protein